MGDIFGHTLGPLVPIEHRLNATAYLSIVADHIHPFMTTVYPSSDGYFQQDNEPSQSSNHLRLVSWTWQWVHFTQMASTVTRSQSNRAPLGCGGTGDLHHGCTSKVYLIKLCVCVCVCACACACVYMHYGLHVEPYHSLTKINTENLNIKSDSKTKKVS